MRSWPGLSRAQFLQSLLDATYGGNDDDVRRLTRRLAAMSTQTPITTPADASNATPSGDGDLGMQTPMIRPKDDNTPARPRKPPPALPQPVFQYDERPACVPETIAEWFHIHNDLKYYRVDIPTFAKGYEDWIGEQDDYVELWIDTYRDRDPPEYHLLKQNSYACALFAIMNVVYNWKPLWNVCNDELKFFIETFVPGRRITRPFKREFLNKSHDAIRMYEEGVRAMEKKVVDICDDKSRKQYEVVDGENSPTDPDPPCYFDNAYGFPLAIAMLSTFLPPGYVGFEKTDQLEPSRADDANRWLKENNIHTTQFTGAKYTATIIREREVEGLLMKYHQLKDYIQIYMKNHGECCAFIVQIKGYNSRLNTTIAHFVAVVNSWVYDAQSDVGRVSLDKFTADEVFENQTITGCMAIRDVSLVQTAGKPTRNKKASS